MPTHSETPNDNGVGRISAREVRVHVFAAGERARLEPSPDIRGASQSLMSVRRPPADALLGCPPRCERTAA